MSGRRLPPPLWLVGLALVPTALVLMPMAYIGARAWGAGPLGLWNELARPYVLGLLANTLGLAAGVTLAAAVLGTALAWCTERCALPAAGLWRVAACLPLAMPAFVASYAWSSLGPAFQGLGGAILILTLTSTPLIYLPMIAALRGMDPGFEDVARSLGLGPLRCFLRTVLPQALPALGGGALLVASHMLGEFGALVMLRVQTFTTAIFDQYQTQFDPAAASLLSAALMALSLPVAFGEMRLRRDRRFARVGRGNARRPAPIRLGWWALPVCAGFALYIGLALGVPLATLLFWLLHGSSFGIGLGAVLPALMDSLALSLPGAVLTTLLALPLVMLTLRSESAAARLADRLPYLVHGLPGIGIALALIAISLHGVPALYQTRLVVMLAYAILFLPLAQSALRASAEQVPPELEEVARSLGDRPLRAFRRVTLPNLLPGAGAALALIILQLMRELTATLLLSPSGVSTLATELWSYASETSYAAAAPFAAALVLISGLPVYVLTVRSVTPDRI